MKRGVEDHVLGRQLALLDGAAARARTVAVALVPDTPSPVRAAAVSGAAAAGLLLLWATGGSVAALLGLLALVAAAVAYARPFLLGPVVALALPAGGRLDVLHAQVAPLEAVVGGGAIGYALSHVVRRERPTLRAHHVLFAALPVALALSALGPARASAQIRESLLWLALGVAFHAVTAHGATRRRLPYLLVALAVPAALEATLALVEYVSTWSQRFSLLDGAIVYPLPQGTVRHANALAQFLVFSGLAVVTLALAAGGRLRKLGIAVAVVGTLALVVTFSRGSWIALVAAGLVFLLHPQARKPLLAGALACAAAAAGLAVSGGAIGARITSLFTPGTFVRSDFRVELAERAAGIVADHPLTGAGTFLEHGVYAGRPDVATHPHDLFLGVAVFFGLPAAVALALLVLLGLRACWRRTRGLPERLRLPAVGGLALLVALLVNGLFEYPFWEPSLTGIVVLALALPFALDESSREALGDAG